MRMQWLKDVDWRLALGLPPKRRFTQRELARAQADTMSATVRVSAVLNIALPVGLALAFFFDTESLPLAAVLVAFSIAITGTAVLAWRDPSRRLVMALYWILPLLAATASGALHKINPYPRHTLVVLWGEMMVGTLALWFCIVWRHHHLDSRLRELDERERAVEMARRLAAAQLEPHFLFNTLASLQHWVDSGDGRAAPFLRSLTGYLRATLPMFERPLQPLGQELEAVRRYLEVMQLRLGSRLQWSIDVDEGLEAAAVPPGALLTLVENAIEHGVEPQLRGGTVQVRGRADDRRHCLQVIDNGAGPVGTPADGQGLANVRQRLQLAFGTSAHLTLAPADGNGCVATMTWIPPPP